MRRGATFRGGWTAPAGSALVVACWLWVTTASGTDGSPAEGGDGIRSAQAAVASKLTAAGSPAASGGSAASSGRSPSSSGGSAASSGGSAASPGGSARTAPVRASPAPEHRAPRPRQLVVVRDDVALSDRPGGPRALRIGSTTEFGSPRVLGVAARRGDWLGVVATERPNNRLAWVRRNGPGLNLRRTGWSLHADLSERTLTLRKDGRRVHRLAVAIGRPGSETPTGRFAVTDKLSGSQFGAYYGCCILALSGHQPNTPPGWTGGDRLAIHGTDAPSTIGTAASAGCMRASDADLRRLMAKVPLGTLVFIRP
jgi:L,D-transpeptidase catalytic domain